VFFHNGGLYSKNYELGVELAKVEDYEWVGSALDPLCDGNATSNRPFNMITGSGRRRVARR
jgi:hypothetical protein